MRLWTFLLVLLYLVGCAEDDPSPTDLLTSHAWDKPEVLHHPTFGVYTTPTCTESYEFKANGEYRFTNYCTPVTVIDGEWIWMTLGQEIKLETSANGVPQKTFRVLILELTQSSLHIKQMEETEPLNTPDYWELKYKPK